MSYFYSCFISLVRRVGVGIGLLMTLGLLSAQAQAVGTPPIPSLAGSAALLPPYLVIPDTTVMPGTTFTLPVTLHPNESAIAATAFSVDYDETWLTFDATDGNGDGLPDAVRFRGPAAFSVSVLVDNNDADGELDLVIADLFPPIARLPSGVLVELTFRAGSPVLTVDAPVKFSTAPAVSFGLTTGQSIPVSQENVGGVVHILRNPAVTASPTATVAPTLPTPTPSAIPIASSTPSSIPTSTPTLPSFTPPSPSPTPTPSPSLSPSATSSFAPTASPTVSASLTPAASTTMAVTPTGMGISALLPDRGGALLPNEVTVVGRHFADGAVATLDTDPVITVTTVYISAAYLRVTIPAGLLPGRYNLTVRNPNGDQATLAGAYQVFHPTRYDDLLGAAAGFWSEPATVRVQSAVQLGLAVYRQGGQTALANVTVQFYVDDPDMGGRLIGVGTIPLLSPRSLASTSVVTWTPPAAGEYTLFAVIDPENSVAEGDEANNRIQRPLTVLAAASDTLAPQVDTFVINKGASSTAVRSAWLDTTAVDPLRPSPGSGIGALFFIEYEYSPSAALWVPVQRSGWLPYANAYAHFAWSLMPGAGMKYLQAWAADQAGNISTAPVETLINYVPPTDHVLPNQVRIYRYALTAEQPFYARLVPTQGDPDLYVWPPDYATRSPWVSKLAGDGVVDELALVAPVTGVYQVEVYGYSAATYQLSITTDAVRAVDTAGSDAAAVAVDKPLVTQPIVALADVPSPRQSLPAALAQAANPQVYLPLVYR